MSLYKIEISNLRFRKGREVEFIEILKQIQVT
jgi:hypothetical protein